jgi:hypothetical protein
MVADEDGDWRDDSFRSPNWLCNAADDMATFPTADVYRVKLGA